MSSDSFHLKYRPRTLSKIIGHEQTVKRLQGIVKSGKVPNALMFIGNTSAGKTTLARAFAADINGVKDVRDLKGSYVEVNASEQRGIDDIRQLISTSRFKSEHKYRVILLDEAQGLLGTQAAPQALLKPLEEPSPTTIWILCTMDAQKFSSTTTGRALANRCSQFVLNPFSEEDLIKQAKRIIKGEDMDYALPYVKRIIRYSNGEMRTIGQIMQALNNYVSGMDKRPKKLGKEALSEVLNTFVPQEDELAYKVLMGVYALQYKSVVRTLLDVQDGFAFVTKLMWGAQHLLHRAVLGNEKHSAIKHWSLLNKKLEAGTKDMGLTLGQLAAVNEAIVNLRSEVGSFAVDSKDLLSARLYRIILTLKSLQSSPSSEKRK